MVGGVQRASQGVDLSKTNPFLPDSGRRGGVRFFIKRFRYVVRAEGPVPGTLCQAGDQRRRASGRRTRVGRRLELVCDRRLASGPGVRETRLSSVSGIEGSGVGVFIKRSWTSFEDARAREWASSKWPGHLRTSREDLRAHRWESSKGPGTLRTDDQADRPGPVAVCRVQPAGLPAASDRPVEPASPAATHSIGCVLPWRECRKAGRAFQPDPEAPSGWRVRPAFRPA